MRYIGAIIISHLALLAAANSVHFINQDTISRRIIFSPEEGSSTLQSIDIPGNSEAHQNFPVGWSGNWYSISKGGANVPGMLGEVRFDGYNGATYFDVSAIVNPNDNEGVKQIFPASTNKPVSGCQIFPCANVYKKADDLQTVSTDSKDLICLLGNIPQHRRRGKRLVRKIFEI
ncbi:putative dnase1 protein [Golovinomyces cichoracearum]|uniref:Putative dnase1 protein n=1 Tax=Golovinomyces cichoracearum TaxID=62708 RepID=A0A420HDS6_9PEZI|nr:putative dnase1 protein [Golovinomyces cichoracearum]